MVIRQLQTSEVGGLDSEIRRTCVNVLNLPIDSSINHNPVNLKYHCKFPPFAGK